jgi:hypothetical protein
MSYDPTHPIDRQVLAREIEIALLKAGFIEEWHGDAEGRDRDPGDWTKERTFYRGVEDVPDLRIVVYTTIVGDTVRLAGKDAIRVAVLYRRKDGAEQGVSRETRVNRTGETLKIVERMVERARGAWKTARTVDRCPRCGAPTFKSKKGNTVCIELCFKRA